MSKLPSEYVLLDIVVVMIVKTHLSPTDAARVSHCFKSNFGKYRGPSVCGGKDSHVGLDLVGIQFCVMAIGVQQCVLQRLVTSFLPAS